MACLVWPRSRRRRSACAVTRSWIALTPRARCDVTKLRLSELIEGYAVTPTHLDAERVERYIAVLDSLPPVVVYTEEGLLLVDGYHRVEAARRRGDEAIEAEVRPGSRDEALAAMKEGRPT
jgi:hypothetical protein